MRHYFDFVSPYPVEDCYNMVLEYSRIDDFRYTKWGETPGNVLEGWLFIGIYVQEEGHLDFVLKSLGNFSESQIRGEGSFKTEGDKTRIRGYTEYGDMITWFLTTNILLIFIISALACGVGSIATASMGVNVLYSLIIIVPVWNIWLFWIFKRILARPKKLLEKMLRGQISRKQKVKGNDYA